MYPSIDCVFVIDGFLLPFCAQLSLVEYFSCLILISLPCESINGFIINADHECSFQIIMLKFLCCFTRDYVIHV